MSELFKDVEINSNEKSNKKKTKIRKKIEFYELVKEKEERDAILKMPANDMGMRLRAIANENDVTFIGNCINTGLPLFSSK